MAFVAYTLLKTTPNQLGCALAPVAWANKVLYFSSTQTLKENDFYSVIAASPNAFDVGVWGKTHPSGEERFYLASGAYFRVYYPGASRFMDLIGSDGSVICRSQLAGVSGQDNVNHAGVLVLFVDTDNQKASVQVMKDTGTRGTTSWNGQLETMQISSSGFSYSESEMRAIYNAVFSSLPPTYPWKEEGTDVGGGEGQWGDDSSDKIDPPGTTDLNTNQLTDTFFVTTYRLSKEELRSLGQVLWTPSVIESLKTFFGNPLESVINLYMLPFDSHKGSKIHVILGNYNTGITGFLTDQYHEVSCGVLDIPEKWGGALDYQSRVQLYLPFIGTKELDTAEVMGGQIGVKYLIDILTGACVAYVSIKRGGFESVLYQFTGNCAYSFPLTQANYNTFYSALLSSTAAVATGIATGGASTPMLVGAGASVAASAKVHVNHSGNLAGNTGYMGIKKPYIILSRPIQALPKDFGKYKGYQSHITKRLSDCKGYTEVEYIHLEGISRATSAELSQIESLLKGGVIIS